MSQKIIIFFIVVFSCFSSALHAQTVSGTITANETWTGVVNVIGDVVVKDSVRLDIAPGTQVNFGYRCKLIVDGSMVVSGTAGAEVSFEAASSSGWSGIILQSKSGNDSTILDHCAVTGVLTDQADSFSVFSPVYIDSAYHVRVSNSHIYGNSIEYYSGGVEIRNCSPYLYNNTIESNKTSATYDVGGGIMLIGSSAIIEKNTIVNNTTTQNGGAVYIVNSNPSLRNNIITGNKAGISGGGIYIYNSNPNLVGNTISGNAAGKDGGGISLAFYGVQSSYAATIDNNAITNNSTTEYGAGIYMSNANPSLQNNVITGNVASINGGGIYALDSNPILSGNDISSNTAMDDGGGIYLKNSNSPITSNTFSGNKATFNGGGIYLTNSSPVMINNLIVNNKSIDLYGSNAAGISFNQSSNAYLLNCTLSGNVSMFGCALYITNSNPEFHNSIFYNNRTPNGDNVAINLVGVAKPVFSFCDVEGGIDLLGGIESYKTSFNMDMSPDFVDATHFTLKRSSACINTGSATFFTDHPNATDLLGLSRTVGSAPDMGAYEYQALDNVILGDLNGQIQWTGPVDVTHNITVNQGSSLWIAAGSNIKIPYGKGITVLGRILANGTTGMPVTFNTGYLKVISTPEADSSIFNYCKFQNIYDFRPLLVKNFSKVRISNSLFLNNRADGGAAIAMDNASIQILNNELETNTGVAIFANNSNPTIIGNSIHDNVSLPFITNGVAISLTNSDAQISNNKIYNNVNNSPGSTSGIYVTNSSPTIADNSLTNNTGSCDGGPIYIHADTIDGSKPVITGNLIAFNNVSSNVGIYTYQAKGSITNNRIYNNKSNTGSGIETESSSMTIANNLIVNNTSGQKAGISIVSSANVLINNTIALNSAGADDGLFISGANKSKMLNTIVYGNTPTNGNYSSAIGLDLGYNYFKDPFFKSPTAASGSSYDASAADWSLNPASECHNTGLVTCSVDTSLFHLDVLKNTRVVNNIDIGAVESQEAEFSKYIYGGSLLSSTKWSKPNYAITTIVCGDVVIPQNIVLTIDSGIQVKFADKSGFNVQGDIIAMGTPSQPISFSVVDTAGYASNTHKGWTGISFSYSANPSSKSELSYCSFQYASQDVTPNGYNAPIYSFSRSNLRVNNCTFKNNKVYSLMYFYDSSPEVSNNIFYNNSCYESLVVCSTKSEVKLYNNKFSNNNSFGASPHPSRLLEANLSSPVVFGNVITNNSMSGSMLFFSGSNSQIMNNVVANNLSSSEEGALNLSNCTSFFQNNIIWNNQSKSSFQVVHQFSSPAFKNNNIQNGALGVQNASSIKDFLSNMGYDPMFANPSAGIGSAFDGLNAKWSLLNISQNINSGDPLTVLPADQEDIDGKSRFYNNTRIDIGAYEHPFNLAPVDSLALIDLYNHTDGANWKNKWNIGVGFPVNTANFFGVTLNGGRVERLGMHDNGLNGNIPSSIKNLIFVEQIQLYDNNFESITPELGELPNLKILNLKSSKISGSIPSQLSDAASLNVLNLSENNLTGLVPPEFGNLGNLALLELSSNKLDSLPNFQGSQLVGNLQLLSVGNNRFQFDDLEPNMNVFPGFTYSPQDSVDVVATFQLEADSAHTFTTTIGGSSNIYTWSFNNANVYSSHNNFFKIDTLQLSNEGVYSCAVTNSVVTGLTIYRRPIKLLVHVSVGDPVVIPVIPYCVGDSSLTIFTNKVNDSTIYWFDASKADVLARSYKLRYTVPVSKDSDIVYVQRKQGSFTSHFVSVPIVIRPGLKYNNGTFVSSMATGASYQWYQNGIQIDGASNVLANKGNGVYQVKLITADKQCESMSRPLTLFDGVITGVNDVSANMSSIQIYPNPASDQIFLRVDNPQQTQYEWRLIDLMGRELKHNITHLANQESVAIDIHDVAPGMYILEVANGLQKTRKQVIKK